MATLTKFNQDETLFMVCGCQNEVLVINYDHKIKVADLSIYSQTFSFKMSWKQKIRYIWNIIVKGTPYFDQIVLDHKQLKQLKEFLLQLN
jgi:hypothetical protein